MYGDEYIPDQSRIELTEDILKKFFKEVLHDGVSGLAVEKDLPYSLVYNLANGRIRSLSAREYRIIFGEEPLPQEGDRVNGAYFRDMVKVWLFLNNGETKSGLYREFYPDKRFRRVDYRIFSGEVKTVEARLERIMEKKFLRQGFDTSDIKEGVKELGLISEKQRVPYESIKPALGYLKEHLKVSPARLLHGRYRRYERGELKTVSKALYQYALKLKEEAADALHGGSRARIERLREKVYGKRRDFTLYVELEDQLRFLKTYGGRSPKRYLGRTIKYYEESKLKRVASWRARKIRNECNQFINSNPGIPLLSIPRPDLEKRVGRLLSVFKSLLMHGMTQSQGVEYEKSILMPSFYEMRRYENERDALTLMDRAAYVLSMSRQAFDLMVAGNRDIFRKIGHYDGRWHLPTRYLQGILEKEGFVLIKEKYEFMARICDNSFPSMKQVSRISAKPTGEPPRQGMDQGLLQGRKQGAQATHREGFGSLWRDVILPEPYGHELFSLMPDNKVEDLNTQWLLYVSAIAAHRNIIDH